MRLWRSSRPAAGAAGRSYWNSGVAGGGIERRTVAQQPGAGDKAYLQPDGVRVLEQYRVVARRPAAFLRCADDRCRHLPQHGRATVHVLARAGSETQVMQTDTLL